MNYLYCFVSPQHLVFLVLLVHPEVQANPKICNNEQVSTCCTTKRITRKELIYLKQQSASKVVNYWMIYTWNPLTPWGPCSPLFPARPWRNTNWSLTWSKVNIIKSLSEYCFWQKKMLTAGPGGPAAPSSPSFPCTPCKTFTVFIRFVPWWSPTKILITWIHCWK